MFQYFAPFGGDKGDCKLIIDHKMRLLNKQLKELQEVLQEGAQAEDDYAREYTVIFNTLLSLENIRLYKLVQKK